MTASLRFSVLHRDGFRCQYCQGMEGPLHVDHITPIAKGGGNGIDNLITSCQRCNLGKGVQSVVVQAGQPVKAPIAAGIEVRGRVYDFDTLVSWRRLIFRETALTPSELVHACSLSDAERVTFMAGCWVHQWSRPAFRKTKVWAMYGN